MNSKIKIIYTFFILSIIVIILSNTIYSQPLIIENSSFFSDSFKDRDHEKTIDDQENIYLTAPINSANFPITPDALLKESTNDKTESFKLSNNSGKETGNDETFKNGLVLHFTFDNDETTSVVTDASGNGNNGKAYGVSWIANGKKGGAYQFTADGNRVEVLNSTSLNTAQLTLAVWIKTSHKDDKWRRIFDKSFDQGFALSIAADWQDNRWSGLASMEIGPGHFGLTRTIVADGQWHHIVITFDGTEQLFFVDGKPQGWPLRWENPGQILTNNFNLVIGCNMSNLGEDDHGISYRGLMDEPMMWNRALSVGEVALLYKSQNKTIKSTSVKKISKKL
ncbi:MAG: LamG domain-containing protein [bacterium]